MTRLRRQYYRQARFSEGTAAQWTAENPVLYLGEPGFESDTRKMKVGDGIQAWSSLQYFGGGAGVTDHGDLDGLGDDDHSAYATTTELSDHITDAAAAHAASAISASSATLVGVGTDVQAVLEELDDAITALGSPAPNNLDYLVGTATGSLSAEIVVGTSPGGELGGTWASPTVDATHSGSAHGDAVTTHEAAGDPHTGYRLESADHSHASTGLQAGNIAATAVTVDSTNLDGTATNVQTVFEELETQVQLAASTHAGAADPHTGYRLESADHSHATTGLQGGQIAGSDLSGTPGGELGNTWASPTVDATHSGSTHSTATDAHIADTGDAHDASAISFDATGLSVITAPNVQDAMEELDAAVGGGGVTSIEADGEGALSGAVTLSEGAGITLTTAGQDIEIASSASAPAAEDVTLDNTGFEELAGDDVQTAINEVDVILQQVLAALEDSEVAIDEHISGTDPHQVYLKESDFDDIDFLVGTATGFTAAEIVVGTSPGGELGGTWATPTVDATHSGSTHTAATDTHIADAADAHDASAISIADAGNDFTATDVEGALDELQADNEAHVAAADPHAGYRLESADHTHQSTGAQAGQLTVAALSDTPGGELGNTWASPTVDATHSGSTHSTATDAHIADTSDAHDATAVSVDNTGFEELAATDVQGALDETDAFLQATREALEETELAIDEHLDGHPSIITIGVLINGGGSAITTGIHPVWRAPYACTVSAVRGYVDTGTTTVINAAKLGTGDFCSADITIDPADAWENGVVNQNATLAAGDTVSVEVATAGTATELTVQVDVVKV